MFDGVNWKIVKAGSAIIVGFFLIAYVWPLPTLILAGCSLIAGGLIYLSR